MVEFCVCELQKKNTTSKLLIITQKQTGINSVKLRFTKNDMQHLESTRGRDRTNEDERSWKLPENFERLKNLNLQKKLEITFSLFFWETSISLVKGQIEFGCLLFLRCLLF